MKERFTDDQIDLALQRIVNDAAFDDSKIDEIADSPQLWWGVQRKIRADEKLATYTGSGSFMRWLLLGASLGLAGLLVAFLLVPRPAENSDEQASIRPAQSLTNKATNDTGADARSIEDPPVAAETVRSIETVSIPTKVIKKTAVEKKSSRPQQPTSKAIIARSETNEVKSEFIALSYARNPDSGQIVRVKVPSSMMVSLGLVASVEKPSNLVNAEILVGDDGTTHAIRFIR